MATLTKIALHFRSFPTVAANVLAAGIKPATQKQLAELQANPNAYDLGDAKYTAIDGSVHTVASAKRKSVEAELTVPTVAEIANSKLLQELVADEVRSFVKAAYVDRFLDIGAHDWNTIEAAWLEAQANGGGIAACPYDDADFTAAQSVFSAYLDTVAPKFAPHCVKVVANRAAKRQVQQCLQRYGYSAKTLSNLLARLMQCVEANAATLSEGALGALGYCAERVETLLKAEEAAADNSSDM